MNDTTRNLVDAIAEGNALGTQNAFAAALAEKLSAKLDDMRQSVAQSMFTQQEAEPVYEAVANTSLGKLAADHYHHHSLHVYGNEAGRTNSQIKAHGANVEKIHSKIAAHHGKDVADAVAKHSDHAATVENASVGHAEDHFHSNFVKKHLGVHGSAEHQEYKKRITHHGDDDIAAHQTEKDWNEHA